MVKGYVVNNLGRGKHIFKMSVAPGMKIPLEKLYKQYEDSYEGKFDLEFLEWLEMTKVPKGSGFDIIVEDVIEDIETDTDTQTISVIPEQKVHPSKLTAKQIAELKIKDKPKAVLQEVMSVHKLRRAYTLCKGRPGEETLLKYIKARIAELS